MNSKICKTCQQERPLCEYSKGHGKCKTCRQDIRKQTYNPEQRTQTYNPEQRRSHYREVEKKKKEQSQENINGEIEKEKWEAVKRNVHCFAIVNINKKDWVCRLKDVPDHVFQHVNMQIPEEHMEWFQANHHKMIHKAK